MEFWAFELSVLRFFASCDDSVVGLKTYLSRIDMSFLLGKEIFEKEIWENEERYKF